MAEQWSNVIVYEEAERELHLTTVQERVHEGTRRQKVRVRKAKAAREDTTDLE